MSNVTRAKAILEALTDKNLSANKVTNLIEGYIEYEPEQDLNDDEARAKVFLDTLSGVIQLNVRAHAVKAQLRINQQANEAAADSAIADLKP